MSKRKRTPRRGRDLRDAIDRAIAEIDEARVGLPAVRAEVAASADDLRFSRHGALAEADAIERECRAALDLADRGLAGAQATLRETIETLDEVMGRRRTAAP